MIRVQLICEGDRDASFLQALVDRCLIAASLEPATIRTFLREANDTHWARASLQGRAELAHPRGKRGVRVFSRGRSGLDKVALHAFMAAPSAELIVMVLDTDGKERFSDRLMEQLGPQWILGVAHPKIEAWGLYLARHDEELAVVGASLKPQLGIDPVQHPHKTSAGGAKKEAKQAFEDVGLTTERMIRLVETVPIETFGSAEKVGLASLWRQLEAWVAELP